MMTQQYDSERMKAEPLQLPAGARPLCLFCRATMDKPGPVAGFLGNIWGTGGLLEGAAGITKFYANSRDASFLVGVARAAVDTARPEGEVRAVLDPSLAGARECAPDFAEALVADPSDTAGGARIRERLARDDWDVVLLIFPDAIGLGAGAMQRLAVGCGRPVYVLNGRRRLFLLDSGTRLALTWRRFLVRSRLVEKLLALLAYPVGAAFVLMSWFAPRRGA